MHHFNLSVIGRIMMVDHIPVTSSEEGECMTELNERDCVVASVKDMMCQNCLALLAVKRFVKLRE